MTPAKFKLDHLPRLQDNGDVVLVAPPITFDSPAHKAIAEDMTILFGIKGWRDDKTLLEAACIAAARYNRYQCFKHVGGGTMIAANALMYHWSLLVFDIEEYKTGYTDRWCYQTYQMVAGAIRNWDGTGDAPDGWHRHPKTGRRREKGNPNVEWIEH